MGGSIPASLTADGIPAVRPRGAAISRWRSRAFANVGGMLAVAITGTLLGVALFANQISPGDPFATVAASLLPPTAAHPMGTDDLGRDVLSGVVHGARTSLAVAGSVSAMTLLAGLVIGATSGWKSGVVDDLLMRLTEFVQVIPRFFLAVVAIALFGPGLDRLILVLGITSWPLVARVVRAQVLSAKTRDFIEAARALGATEARIVVRDVLPNVLTPAIVTVSVNAAGVILLEAGLSFLGLGDPSRVSWGYLANNAQRFLRVAWWMAVFPGAAIALAALGLNLLGDTLNEALTPPGR